MSDRDDFPFYYWPIGSGFDLGGFVILVAVLLPALLVLGVGCVQVAADGLSK